MSAPVFNRFLLFSVVGLFIFCESILAQTVRVRLLRAKPKVEISGIGVSVADRVSPFQNIAVPKLQTLMVSSFNAKEASWNIANAETGEVLRLKGNRLSLSGEMLKVAGEPAASRLQLWQRENGTIDVISLVDMDQYLAGVLPHEMPLTWPLEALKAQVVAIRSYAMYSMGNRRSWHFDMDSTIQDQVYKGFHAEKDFKSKNDKLARAIAETHGEYLIYKNRILKTYYHAHCGGKTESAKAVWGGEEPTAGAIDSFCPTGPLASWEFKMSHEELHQRLKKYFDISKSQGIREVSIQSRTDSGRVANLAIVLADETKIEIPANDFRRVLGFARVKSTNFDLNWSGQELSIVGRGNGHGVGLCQWGSRKLAEKGSSYRAILKHYYPVATLRSPKTAPQSL